MAAKKLEEMSLPELWSLFPIFLVPYNPEWKNWYEEEKKRILSFVPRNMVFRISPIGSTSFAMIEAKPIVDILLEAPSKADLNPLASFLKENGYREIHRDLVSRDFNRGYTEKGFAQKVFHLHERIRGDNKELYFRDYLIAHPEIAKAYETLKLGLWKKYEHNRDAYTNAKGSFIKKYTDLALIEFKGRYE
jgi:GrpB-like predicted nucleotidyltransferase (UPF0157 family)